MRRSQHRVEVVPSAQETTAITFRYDAPGSCAPQAILLAVPPQLGQAWDLETLEATLLETLELAKLRSVHPALHRQADQLDVKPFLPALYFAFNPSGDTISTDFLRPSAWHCQLIG